MKYHCRKEIGNGFDQNLSVSICKFIMYEYLISDLRIWMSFISQTRLYGLWFFDFYWEELFFLWKYSYIMRSLIKFSSETKKRMYFLSTWMNFFEITDAGSIIQAELSSYEWNDKYSRKNCFVFRKNTHHLFMYRNDIPIETTMHKKNVNCAFVQLRLKWSKDKLWRVHHINGFQNALGAIASETGKLFAQSNRRSRVSEQYDDATL